MTADRLEARLGRVLGIGSALSTWCLALGLAALLMLPVNQPGVVLVNAGLVMVMATPVARVIVATIGFIQSREWRFVAMTVTVLVVLGLSVVAAFS